MTELCINTETDLPIGEITYGETLGAEGFYQPTALRVLEEVSVDTYLAFVQEHRLMHQVQRDIRGRTDLHFYRVEVLD